MTSGGQRGKPHQSDEDKTGGSHTAKNPDPRTPADKCGTWLWSMAWPGTAKEGGGSTVHGPCCHQRQRSPSRRVLKAGKGRICEHPPHLFPVPLLILSLLILHSLLVVFP